MKTQITIPENIDYISQALTHLPSKCIFDKGKVGCGGTTLAINDDLPYVIAVPYVSLIENKMMQHDNIYGYYGNAPSKKELVKYLNSTTSPKIFTTYDSLEKLTNHINYSKFNLLIDEYHLLFTQYSFRDEAVNKVLSNYYKYNDYCFMTATLLENEFILDELKEVPIVEAVWQDVINVKVQSVLCPKGVLNSIIELVNHCLNEDCEFNLYIFVNSVEFIKNVVKEAKLTEDTCNVIYSKNNLTNVGIERGILPSLKDGSIKSKKINLLTSTVFEGSDIYDENGKTIIVSDPTKSQTLIDISTSFQQIANRVRNSKYNDNIVHYYNNTRYSNITYKEFQERSLDEIDAAKTISIEYNSLSERARRGIAGINEVYIGIEKKNKTFYFNPNLVKLDLYNFKICKHLYSIRINGLTNEYKKHGFDSNKYIHKSNISIAKKDLESFKETTIEIEKYYDCIINNTCEEIQKAYIDTAFKKYNFLKEAIEKLGFDEIKKLKYNQTTIKRKLLTYIDNNLETKIYKMLKVNTDITSGNFIASSVLKKRFKNIYEVLNISKIPKASELEKFFYCKRVKKWIDNKSVDGYILLNPKLFFN